MWLFQEVLPEGIVVWSRNKLNLKARNNLLVFFASLQCGLEAHNLLLNPILDLTAFVGPSVLRTV